jgi:type VI secretion system secreted protein VgrG
MPIEVGDIEVTVARQVMAFHSGALEGDELLITALEGVESMSHPYRFHLELASRDADIDLIKMLKEPAHIAIKQAVKLAGENRRGITTLKIHGVLSHFEQVGRELEWVKYRATLAPRLWLLSNTRNSRIFQDKTVPQIVEAICNEHSVPLELKLTADYKKRDFVMQYEESDLDFVHRWLEHEGIFYYFEQREDDELLVLGDSKEAYGALPGDGTFRYKPMAGSDSSTEAADSESAGEDWFSEEVVHEISGTVNRLPKEVILNDYNWRDPDAKLAASAEVSPNGHGTVYEYNNHYETDAEGKALAKIRAEELSCREHEFRGKSHCRGFRAGHTFTLEEHYRGTFNGKYLIASVTHRATQSIALGSGSGSGATYSNSFYALQTEKTFRPRCETPWPSIKGVMHARVDGGDSGTPYAQIDEKGRYKVRLPLDHGDASDGSASKYVRKMEPYAGPRQGMHFPLLKDAEVLLTYLDGDPDRPIISGAVFNAKNTTVVNNQYHTHNKFITPANNTITFDDLVGGPSITINTNESKNVLKLDGTVGAEKITIGCEISSSYIRLGKGGRSGESKPDKVTNADGFYLNVAGDINLVSGAKTNMNAGGDFNQKVSGAADIHIVGAKNEKVDGNKVKKTLGISDDLVIGDFKVVNFSAKLDMSVGAKATISVGAEVKLAASASLSVTAGASIEISASAKLTLAKSASHAIGKDSWTFKCANSWSAKAVGACKLESLAGPVTIEGGTGVVLKCGSSRIAIGPGKIVISSPQVIVRGQSKVDVSSSGALNVKASGPVKIKGAIIKAN